MLAPQSAVRHARRVIRVDVIVVAMMGILVSGWLWPGLVQADTIRVGTIADEAGITLRSQTASGVEIHYGMLEFGLDDLEIDGETYKKLSLPNVLLPADAGTPDLPGMGRFVALPQGATPRLVVVSSRTRTFENIDLAPAPVIPRETDPGPLVYEKNLDIYTRDALFPENPVRISEPGKMRGVDVIRMGITPFQYNPVTRQLVVYTEIDLRIEFQGGSGRFGEDRLRSRFWEPILAEHLLNYGSLPPIEEQPRGNREGSEYVIICPDHPDFITWANIIRDWRRLQGIYTDVYTTTDIGGTTAGVIESWLNNAYTNWAMPPAAFLILGDYPGTGLLDSGVTSPIWNGYCVSDNIYADVDADDLPDMIHARITARDAAELEIMIGKMMDYETAPPTDAGYYDHPVFAGGWQTERWFILCTEICLGFQEQVLGKHPIREYAIYSGTPGTSWSSNPNTPQLLAYFGPAGLGYIPATPGHLTDWGANAARLNADMNAGTYMLMHRDHGYELGWGEPSYSNSDLAGLHNDLLPFVFSMNCLTGKYNYSGESFTEAFHRMSQGALGLVAASEVSYSFVNDTFVFGLYDTMWPEFMPDYGPFEPQNRFAPNLRTAFGMASGKYFLESSSWPYNPGDKTVTYHLFHHHGDAFLTLYSEVPQTLTISHDDVLLLGLDTFSVQAEAGTLIGLSVDGEVVGSVHATGLPQQITITPQETPGTLVVTATKADRYRYQQDVPIIPPDGPYLVFDACAVLDTDGDGDGILDAGEGAGMDISLQNVGVAGTSNVTGTLTSDDPLVDVVVGGSTYPDIPAGTTAPCLVPYEITISGAAPDGHVAVFEVTAQSTEGQWSSSFQLPVQAPVLNGGRVTVDDESVSGDGDGVPEPGETILVFLRISNDGHSATGQLSGTLMSMNQFVVIENSQASCDPIDVGAQGQMGAWQVRIESECPSPTPIPFTVLISGPQGFEATLPMMIDVGGWFDDVEGDRGWTLGLGTDTASTGRWIRAEPVGTLYNGVQVQPEYDHTVNPAEICFVTGNGSVGGAAGEQDVDGGRTTLLTPIFDLAGATTATVSYWRWYSNDQGNNPGEDYWNVDVTSSGLVWVPLEHTNVSANVWTEQVFDLLEVIEPSSAVQLRFVAADEGVGGSLVEAAVDDFTMVAGFGPTVAAPDAMVALRPGLVSVGPNPFNPQVRIVFRTTSRSEVDLALYDVQGRLVRSLVHGVVEAGEHAVRFDGRTDSGRDVASGVYFVRMKTPEFLEYRQITLLK